MHGCKNTGVRDGAHVCAPPLWCKCTRRARHDEGGEKGMQRHQGCAYREAAALVQCVSHSTAQHRHGTGTCSRVGCRGGGRLHLPLAHCPPTLPYQRPPTPTPPDKNKKQGQTITREAQRASSHTHAHGCPAVFTTSRATPLYIHTHLAPCCCAVLCAPCAHDCRDALPSQVNDDARGGGLSEGERGGEFTVYSSSSSSARQSKTSQLTKETGHRAQSPLTTAASVSQPGSLASVACTAAGVQKNPGPISTTRVKQAQGLTDNDAKPALAQWRQFLAHLGRLCQRGT